MSTDPPADFGRYQNSKRLTKAEREQLLRDYFAFYRTVAKECPELLNQKIARSVFDAELNEIASSLKRFAKILAREDGPVQTFLERNPLPPGLSQRLEPEFRVFCLLLNALKQWVSAEQQATDRFLLGANARNDLRRLAGRCLVSNENLDEGCELHHPIRDGRPPIPLTKTAHQSVEQQGSRVSDADDGLLGKLQAARGQNSWANLRRGCLDLLGDTVAHSTPNVGAGAKHFARKAAEMSALNYRQIINWLDQTGR